MPAKPDFDALADSWMLKLRAERKTAGTLKTYRNGLKAYADWAAARDDEPSLTGAHVQLYLAEFFDRGGAAKTAQNYLTALRLFADWCVGEGELAANQIGDLKKPKSPKVYRAPLSAEELEAMIATCDRSTFLGKRDEAVLRFLVDTGGRASEVLALTVDTIWVTKGRVLFKGKGDKERLAAFTPETGLAIDRYLRARRKHKHAEVSQQLWLTAGRGQFSYYALWAMVKKRAALAGVTDAHPHRFRRTFADNWLSAGGSVDGLMAVAGWENMEMVKLYAGARANVRALEEHQRIFGEK